MYACNPRVWKAKARELSQNLGQKETFSQKKRDKRGRQTG